MVLCVVVGCSSKTESTKALSFFVYLRLLQIEGKNRRNSLLKEKREDFYGELGDHKQETRECQRVNEFVANTSL